MSHNTRESVVIRQMRHVEIQRQNASGIRFRKPHHGHHDWIGGYILKRFDNFFQRGLFLGERFKRRRVTKDLLPSLVSDCVACYYAPLESPQLCLIFPKQNPFLALLRYPRHLSAIAGIDPINESLTHTIHIRTTGVTVSFQFFPFDPEMRGINIDDTTVELLNFSRGYQGCQELFKRLFICGEEGRSVINGQPWEFARFAGCHAPSRSATHFKYRHIYPRIFQFPGQRTSGYTSANHAHAQRRLLSCTSRHASFCCSSRSFDDACTYSLAEWEHK
mmetsp:Transcript_6951/g.6127  ORF Transcript_6951/g.6127 Transcript_6951/m.6127 type:complete len:276 (-) Transcript_6951:31-858(-)